MNEKFNDLPQEKQNRILTAGYRVFAHNSYRKSPVGEIAAEAGISKSLLFHYFRNKKELYLYLLEKGGETTLDALNAYGCMEEQDRFRAMILGMKAKLGLMRTSPDLSTFMIRAYFEKDPEVAADVKAYMDSYEHIRKERFLIGEEKDTPGHLAMMYKTMQLTVEGFLFEKLFRDDLDPGKMEKEFSTIIDYWSHLYKRQSVDEPGNRSANEPVSNSDDEQSSVFADEQGSTSEE